MSDNPLNPKTNITLVENFEEKIGYKLPLEYRNFLLECNGEGLNNKTVYITDLHSDIIIQNFFGIEIPNNDIYEWLKELKDDIKDKFLPIASDPGGNFLLLDIEIGKVYYWDSARHFPVSSDSENTHLVADSFSQLLNQFQ